MSLGVLNNLTAMYAENNLNNTTNSLSKVLNQLSSGSKINSGADDAAGLSLVDGLQANSQALAQSQTNAQEGVGLLQVADGALSQVTSLLNRAVTLATEASNGTLNSSQDTAANNEYQSILSEINNIGTTTTYNQQQVFNSQTSIYTGDSSAQGSSINNLNISSLSSANLGDTNGVMSYSNGQSNVFINLSSASTNAAVTDSLNSSASTTISVSYLTKGANGSAVSANANISVGSGTSYANTAQGLISAINNSGLGLNATFSTAAQAGSAATAAADAANGAAGSTNTGIQISAAGIGANGTGTNGVGVVGALSLASGDTLGGTLSIVGSDGASHNVTLGTASSTDTLQNLESVINSSGWGVTASINQAGTQMTFTSSDSAVSVTGTNLTQNTAPAAAQNIMVQGSGLGSLTVGSAADTLTGTLNITEGADGSNTASTLTLGTQGSTDTLANLATTINGGGYGITATLNQAGTTISFAKSSGDAGTAAIAGSNIEDVAAPAIGVGSTLGTLSVASAGDTLGVSTQGDPGVSSTVTIKSGITGQTSTLNLGTAGSTDTLANLAATINSGNYGITATLDQTGTDLTFAQSSGSFAAGVTGSAIDTTYTSSPIQIAASATLGSITVNGAGDTVSGVKIESTSNSGVAGTALDLTTTGQTLASIADDFNNGAQAGQDITAVLSNNGNTLTFEGSGTQTNGGNTVTMQTGGGAATTSYTDTVGSATLKANIVTVAGSSSLGQLSVNNSTDQLSGDLNITSGTTGTAYTGANGTPLSLSNQTLTQIAATMNSVAGQAKYGITATLSNNNTTLTFTANTGAAYADSAKAAISTTYTAPSTLTMQAGTQIGAIATAATSATDLFSGTLVGTNATGAAYSLKETDQTQAQIVTALAGEGITANIQSTTSMALTETSGDAYKPTISNTLTETVGTTNGAAGSVVIATPIVGSAYKTDTITSGTSGDLLSGTITGTNASGTAFTASFTDVTKTHLEDDFNGVSYVGGGTGGTYQDLSGYGLSAVATSGTVTTISEAVAGNTAAIATSNLTEVTATGAINAAAAETAAATPLQTITATSGALGGNLNITSAATGLTTTVAIAAGQTIAQLTKDFNGTADGGNVNHVDLSAYGLTATATVDGTAIILSQTSPTATYQASVSGMGTTTAASLTETPVVNTGTTLGSLTATSANDTLSGAFTIQSGAAKGSAAQDVTFNGTLTQIMDQINQGGYGITAALNTTANSTTGTAAGTVLTFTQTAGDAGTATITNNGVVLDTTAQVNNSNLSVSSPNSVLGSSPTNLGTLTAASSTDVLSGSLNLTEATDGLGDQSTYSFTGQTLQQIANEFNSADGGQYANLGIAASVNATATTVNSVTYAAGTILTFTQTGADGTATVAGTGIGDVTPASAINQSVAAGTMQNTISVASSTDKLSGDLTIQEGLTSADTQTANFAIGGLTIANIAANFNDSTGETSNWSSYGISAAVSGDTLTLTQTVGDAGTAKVTSNSTTPMVDTLATASQTSTGTFNTTGTMLNTLTVAGASDTLTGTLNIQEGADGNKTQSTYNLNGQTVAEVAAVFNTGAEKNLGISATVNADTYTQNSITYAAGTVLTFTQSTGDLGTAKVTDATNISDRTASLATPTVSVTTGSMMNTMQVNGTNDTLGGTLNLTSGVTGAVSSLSLGTQGTTDTLANLASTINSGSYGITAALNAAKTELTFTQNAGDGFTASVGGTSISDTMGTNLASSTNLGTLTVSSSTDKLTGTLTGIEGNGSSPYTLNLNGQTLAQVASTINTTDAAYGITATLNQAGTSLSFAATSGDAGTPTIGNQGYISDATPSGVTSIGLTNQPSATESYYSLGVSGNVADTTTTGGTANVGIATNHNGSGGTATISYSDAAGQSLSSTDLSNQTDAEAALTDLNAAITDVAAQDGYIGAQINTLNAVSSVLSTQQQNVVSAQNAVQATDYASATSDMSKYEILSQTGIAALAQANSLSQEVTKLLQ